MNLLCPNCQKMVTVQEEFAGRWMKCPLCNRIFTVPDQPNSAQPSILGGQMKFAWIPAGIMSRTLDAPSGCLGALTAPELAMPLAAEPDPAGSYTVTITKGLYMGVVPVTQTQFKSVMGYNPAHFKGDENRPVEMVNWFDCQDFCKKLAELTGKPIRLPTEAEWEYGCRAGSLAYYSGDGDTALKKVGWFSDNSGGAPQPVGQLEPNTFGLYDLHGNVWEWCLDWFRDSAQLGVRAGHHQSDPKGPKDGQQKVLRGGSWGSTPHECLAASRGFDDPGNRTIHYGFRVCFQPDDNTVDV
jgi:formylglycine-generating enzyme required for sulfatase activity